MRNFKQQRNDTLQRIITLSIKMVLLLVSFNSFGQPNYYLRDHEPWGTLNNSNAMAAVFGIENYITADYTISPATVFSNSTRFVYMEGGEMNDAYMNNFLQTNRTLLETWVFNGGRLFLNSAGWTTGMDYGFGGISLNYGYPATHSYNVLASDADHPVFNGPFTPVGSSFSGNFYAHDYITGPGLTNIILGTAGGNAPVLASKNWGSGLVLFGGITSPFFHQPQPNAQNLFQNILAFLNNYQSCPSSLGISSSVTHVLCPGGSNGVIDLSISAGTSPYSFSWSNGQTTEDISSLTAGNYSVQVTDDKGCTDNAIITVQDGIDNVKPAITTNGNKSVNNDAGKCGAAVTVSASATDNCSVGSPTGVRSDGKALTDDFPVGTTTINWNVTDANGNPADQISQTVTVANATPIINSLSAPVDPSAINNAVSLSGNYTDNNASSASINWGDGSTVQTVNSPAASFIVPHTYLAAGVYTVRVKVKDVCNQESEESVYQYIVVYDPSAGFVTGGGWINSPLGAYAADPTLFGKANFGFVSKYEKGKTVPTGNTEFQFHAGNLNFKSTSYEWLVISGSRAQFKGVGTINGTGNYGFLLTAIDGILNTPATNDRFRIKIWDRSTSSIVYDNQMGDADDAAATTDIAGGSIVIQTPKAGKTKISNDVQDFIVTPLSVKAMPNPTSHSFQVVTLTSNKELMQVRVTDLLGREVEVKKNIIPASKIELGGSYLPGIYIIEVSQGSERATLRVVKQ